MIQRADPATGQRAVVLKSALPTGVATAARCALARALLKLAARLLSRRGGHQCKVRFRKLTL